MSSFTTPEFHPSYSSGSSPVLYTAPALGLGSVPHSAQSVRAPSLSIKTASGFHVSLLNEPNEPIYPTHRRASMPQPLPSLASLVEGIPSSACLPVIMHRAPKTTAKRKYKCNYIGCGKAFTTSGHLSRHQRIHTGEKNFVCLFPGCMSRFSRQDNMMQHYRTHLSPRSRAARRSRKMQEEWWGAASGVHPYYSRPVEPMGDAIDARRYSLPHFGYYPQN